MLSSIFRIAIGVVVCLALGACSKQGVPSANAEALCDGCNVILISMDTVRADHLSAYGYERKTSPNVDRLARRSVIFENAISQSSWTLPAHGSMMTGLYPGRLGVEHYPAKRRLPDTPTMLAEVFGKAGYATGGFTGGGVRLAGRGDAAGVQCPGRRIARRGEDPIGARASGGIHQPLDAAAAEGGAAPLSQPRGDPVPGLDAHHASDHDRLQAGHGEVQGLGAGRG